MRKIPEKYELDEDDIKDAITQWLNDNHTTDDNNNAFIIEFKTEIKTSPPPGGYRGGMSDPIEKVIVSAIAEKE